MARIDLKNTTGLSSERLLDLFHGAAQGWAVGTVKVLVRPSRSADYSGTCFYTQGRIHINLSGKLKYPYAMGTYLARAKTIGRRWYKPIVFINMRDGYDLAMFVFLHELYHLLVQVAKRNPRQKESMCDRFAARHLVDHHGLSVLTAERRTVERSEWDFQDLDRFVAGAVDRRVNGPTRRAVSATWPRPMAEQGLLFPI